METTSVTETPTAVKAAPQTPKTPTFKAPKKKRKWVKPLVIILVVLALVFWFFIRPMMSAGQKMLSSVYLTDTAQLRDMTVSVSSTGTVTPTDSSTVTPMATGEVLEAPFEVGDTVEAGQVLYRLDDKDAQTALRRAEIALQQAQLSYDNLSTNLGDATLTANASGLIAKLYVDAGDTVAAGSPVADILDRATMELKVPFHSADAAAMAVGQAALVTVDGTLEALSGTVTKVSALEEVGPGGALTRSVTVSVPNPGALTSAHTGTAVVNGAACSAPGAFTYAAQKTVYAKTSGELARLLVAEGDAVTDGQVLGSFSSDAISTQVESARLTVENAALSLQTARDALDNFVITSPISGTVISKSFDAGDKVDTASLSAAGGAMAVIYDLSALTFEMKISELDVNKIMEGQEVSVTASAVEGRTYTGVVDQVRLSGVTVSGMTSYPVKVLLREHEDLKPGMNVSADVIVEKVGTVLSVPVEAVKQGAQSPYVMVAAQGALDSEGRVTDLNRLERRDVTLGRNDESYIEITGGLAEGEVVVWENQATNPFAAMMGMGM